MAAAVPTSVMVRLLLEILSVTPPAAPSTGVENVPALAVRVTVNVSLASTSAKLMAERSTLEAVSSVTVISVGAPVTVGASFVFVISMLMDGLEASVALLAGFCTGNTAHVEMSGL